MLTTTNLVGFGGKSSSSGSRTFTLVGTAVGGDTSIEINSISPGSIASGDFCVIQNHTRASNAGGDSRATAVTPSGFTNHLNASQDVSTSAGDIRVMISSKILTGTESTVTGMNGGVGEEHWSCFVFRPSSAISTVMFTASTTIFADGNPGTLTIDPSAQSLAILVGGLAATTAITSQASSPSLTEVAGDNSEHFWYYRIDNTTPSSTILDMDDEGLANTIFGGYFTFT